MRKFTPVAILGLLALAGCVSANNESPIPPTTQTTTTEPPTTTTTSGQQSAPSSAAKKSISRAATPESTGNVLQSVSYANCDAVRAAGKAPIRRGDPDYAPKLDRDGDGVGCE